MQRNLILYLFMQLLLNRMRYDFSIIQFNSNIKYQVLIFFRLYIFIFIFIFIFNCISPKPSIITMSGSSSSSSINHAEFQDNTLQTILLTQNYIQQACKLINDSFITSDPVLSKYVTKVSSQIQQQTRFYVSISIKNNLGVGVILRPSNILVGVSIGLDVAGLKQIILSYQESLPKQPHNDNDSVSDKIQSIYKIYEQLQNILLQQQCKKGQYVYGAYLGINPKFAKYKLGTLVQAIGIKRAFGMGYKKMYGVIYNPAAIRLHLALGGKILAKRRHQEQKLEFNLCQFKSTQIQLANQYVQMNKKKSLKELLRSGNLVKPVSVSSSLSKSSTSIRSKL